MFAGVAIILNLLLIPDYGLIGAAVATTIAYVFYAFAKAYYVYLKLKIHPWTYKTNHVLLIITGVFVTFYFWDFTWNPFFNILCKSLLIGMFFSFLIFYFKVSREVNAAVYSFIEKLKRLQ